MHVISRALRTHCVVAVLALTATLVTSVHADDIDEITVTATRIERPLSRLPFSADVVTRDNIASAQPLLGLDESLQQVPGLQMQNRFNFAQDLRISMRGFGARAAFGIRGIRIIVDGIPETLPDGQSGVDGIDLGSAQRIEVLRGGASAIYGNAGGGVILVDSRTGSDVFTSEVALAAGADEVAVFAAASESFSQKNINCSIEESIQRFEPVAAAARDAGIPMRGYVSCVAGCPYEGHIAPEAVLSVSHQLLELGCYEVSLGDTIGMGTAGSIRTLLQQLLAEIPASKLALHCHNTYGQALANILAGIDLGITRIDSSVAGLGGCPYAKGASGNVATEDVVYMLHGMGLQTGIDLDGLIALGTRSCDAMGISNQSSVSRARAH